MKSWIGIIIHCSASNWGNAMTINRWHRANGWSGIGYNFVIQNGNVNNIRHIKALDGQIEVGRSLEKSGAHAKGYNSTHIGICSISSGVYTEKQASSLYDLVEELMGDNDVSIENIMGHNEVSHKSCPCFSVAVLRDALTKKDKCMFLKYMGSKDSKKE